MLKLGLAHVYRQCNAVYDGQKKHFEKIEALAKAKQINIWSLGEQFESPSAYKSRLRAGARGAWKSTLSP